MFNRPQRATNFDNINTMKKIATITTGLVLTLRGRASWGDTRTAPTPTGTADAN